MFCCANLSQMLSCWDDSCSYYDAKNFAPLALTSDRLLFTMVVVSKLLRLPFLKRPSLKNRKDVVPHNSTSLNPDSFWRLDYEILIPPYAAPRKRHAKTGPFFGYLSLNPIELAWQCLKILDCNNDTIFCLLKLSQETWFFLYADSQHAETFQCHFQQIKLCMLICSTKRPLWAQRFLSPFSFISTILLFAACALRQEFGCLLSLPSEKKRKEGGERVGGGEV